MNYFRANKIEAHLWLGSEFAALQDIQLKKEKIKKIMTVGSGMEPAFPKVYQFYFYFNFKKFDRKEKKKKDFEYFVVEITDESSSDILYCIPFCLKVLEEWLSESKKLPPQKQFSVLVHWYSNDLIFVN